MLIIHMPFLDFVPQQYKSYVSHLFPHAIIHNESDSPIHIIIDPDPQHHPKRKHSLVSLLPKQSTLQKGILDPEAVIMHKHLHQAHDGSIWAHRYVPVLKTPAGFSVWVYGDGCDIVRYHYKPRGWRGSLIKKMLHPSIKDTNSFSKGYFIRPFVHSSLREEYDNIAQPSNRQPTSNGWPSGGESTKPSDRGHNDGARQEG